MPNVNTIADAIYLQNNGQPVVMNVTSQQHQYFMIGAGAIALTIPNPMALAESAKTFPGRAAQTLPFILRAAGTITFSARGKTYQIDINQGTGITPAIASTGLQTVPNGAGTYKDNWLIEVEGMWDSTSLNLRGIYYGWAGANAISQATLVGSAPAALANLQFTCAVTVNDPTVVAPTSFTLNEFSIELV